MELDESRLYGPERALTEDQLKKKVFTETLLNGYIKNGKITTPPNPKEKSAKHTNGMSNGTSKQQKNEKTTQKPKKRLDEEYFEQANLLTYFYSHAGYMILNILAFVNLALFGWKGIKEPNRQGYKPMYSLAMSSFLMYVYRRIRDCWNVPICGVPGVKTRVQDRYTDNYGWSFKYTGKVSDAINAASYNYLGFAQNTGPCADAAIKSIYDYGITTGSSRANYGTCEIHNELEKLTAEFLGVDDSITFGMGFATNTYNIPLLVSKGCLVVSDCKNHSSIILGIKLSRATVKVFKHNNMKSLEKVLGEAILKGQPGCKQYTPWRKILIIVEGIYSMEATIVRLPEIIELKKKYKAYLYVDEAHSIGSLGRTGRGVLDYWGCNPKDVDVLMGTYTKSFGSAGGYLAGRKEIINYFRLKSAANAYAMAMSPPVAAQIISVYKILMGKDGTNEGAKRLNSLARNTQYFRKKLMQRGLVVYGNVNSPVIPIITNNFSKVVAMAGYLQKKYNFAVIGVGYPAVPLMEARLRICLSAGHTQEQLDKMLDAISDIAAHVGCKYSRMKVDMSPIDYYKVEVY